VLATVFFAYEQKSSGRLNVALASLSVASNER
jgi:hypothetical protein